MAVVEHRDLAPAITALGSLFKLTEIYLRDDASRELPFDQGITKAVQGVENDGDGDDSDFFSATDCSNILEDEELNLQMSAMGLPMSFNSNKEKRNGRNKGLTKCTQLNNADVFKGTLSEAVEPVSTQVNVCEIKLSELFHERAGGSECCVPITSQVESSRCNVAEDARGCELLTDDSGNPVGLSNIIFSSGEKQHEAGVSDVGQGIDHESRIIEIEEVIAVSSTSLDAELSSGSCLTDAAEYDHTEPCDEVEDKPLEASSSAFHGGVHGNIDVGEEQLEGPESTAFLRQTLVDNGFENYDSKCNYGDWLVFWDSHYMRNYFYNSKTQTSTWSPPEGMEDLCDTNYAVDEVGFESVEMDISPTINAPDICTLQDDTNLIANSNYYDELVSWAYAEIFEGFGHTHSRNIDDSDKLSETSGSCVDGSLELVQLNYQENAVSCMCLGSEVPEIQLETQLGTSMKKQKKKVRRARNKRKLSTEKKACKYQELGKLSTGIEKYWWQRYLLFSKYDDGIKMDEEGWFSVTPEPLARHHAFRCGGGVIIDSFTGVGGNAIQFANRSKHVIAVDIDPKKIEYAHHNAVIYGVHDQIDFIEGDFFLLAPMLKADTIFLSPPWGGPDYLKVKTYDLKTMLQPRDGYFLFDTAKKIAPKIVMFLPRNVDLNQLAELSLSSSPPWSLEVEKNFVNGKLKAITAYFSNTAISGNQAHSSLYHEKAWGTFCEY